MAPLHCKTSPLWTSWQNLNGISQKLGFLVRASDRMVKVVRTIADLASAELRQIRPVAELMGN
jgi:predicted ATPase with chaperone activity